MNRQFVIGLVIGASVICGIFMYNDYSKHEMLAIRKSRKAKTRKYHICWAVPKPSVLAKCSKQGTCSGAGTYAYSRNRKIAKHKAMRLCRQEYKSCVFDYCEVKGTQ